MSKSPKRKVERDYHKAGGQSPHSDDHLSVHEEEGSLTTNYQKKDEKVDMNKKQGLTVGLLSAAILSIVGFVVVAPYLEPQFGILAQYEFRVFCPANKVPTVTLNEFLLENEDFRLDLPNKEGVKNDLRMLFDDVSWKKEGIDKYLIYIQAHETVQGDSSSSNFMYCSYVANWEDRNCDNPAKIRKVCSMPGPIFYVKRNEPVQVAWISNIKKQISQAIVAGSTCYSNYSASPFLQDHCTIYQKGEGADKCTYLDPTKLTPAKGVSKSYVVSNQNVPLSIHIHGLEVRPTFDGNPLSWLGQDGSVGPGYFSLHDQDYYNSFNHSYPSSKLLTGLFSPNQQYRYLKLSRYENFQPAGNLWYHDHAMHVTKVNVDRGMAGNYIIHDPAVDQTLPGNQFEILIVAAKDYNKTNTTKFEPDPVGKGHHRLLMTDEEKVLPRRNPPLHFVTQTNLTFERNQTYRIRILNGQFDTFFQKIMFLTHCNEKEAGFNPYKDCSKTLEFSVIGADSCLFDRPIRPEKFFLNISSSERFEILLTIDGKLRNEYKREVTENQIDPSYTSIYLLAIDGSAPIILNRFEIAPLVRQMQYGRLARQVTEIPGVDKFYNLSHINSNCKGNGQDADSTTCLSVHRMRPILRDVNFRFLFNGHYHFTGSGTSQNSKIGTTEDWYFINTMFINHPIHVHLINYQVIAKAQLKGYKLGISGQECTFYEIDFYRLAGVLNATTPLQLCQQIRKLSYIKDTNPSVYVGDQIKNKYKQNQIDPKTLVSGLDVRALKDREYTDFFAKMENNCPESPFKYICSDFSNEDIPLEYRRWKEVALIPQHVVTQVRIRWTQTQYNPETAKPTDPYFSVPEDQLIEHPGFIYHCHFLHHEDNELMRPIMMNFSDRFRKDYKIRQGHRLFDCMTRNKKNLQGGWEDRYECMNQVNNCSAA